MNFEIIPKNQNKIQSWSGGTTTEIFIYPKNSIFKDLNFDFRISKATIEVDESNFSSLPNMNRILVLLDGKLELIHENHHQIELKPLEYDHFKGDWKTKSKGIASDFNLIFSNKLTANLKIIHTIQDFPKLETHSKSVFCFYILQNHISFKEKIVKSNELLVIYPPILNPFEIKIPLNTVLIGIEIKNISL